ncbi:hypothetical protein [Caldilinea sp.]|uniref:hypothetical protein n=1 Tax=Caldilinea sp. TaxID=2293560 RepID=UPI00263296AF|nr:hypothetical protein [uncultured Caldilinea sp.]
MHPSEIVTLAILFALKGVGDRAFSRWLVRDWRPLFPKLPERTRLFRLFKTHPLIRSLAEEMFILVDHGFFSQTKNPANMKVCKRGSWNVRMMAETVLSMSTTVRHCKRLRHRVWEYFKARLTFTMAAFNLLVQWHGLHPDENGVIRLSIAEFSL